MKTIRRKLALALVIVMLAGLVLPAGSLVVRADATTYFSQDFTGYTGSATTQTPPVGMGMSNFSANHDYVIGENESAKFVSNTSGKFLQLYKSFAGNPIVGEVALEARLKFGDTQHERRIFNVDAASLTTTYKVTKSLVVFGADGNVSVLGNVYGTYSPDVWYDVKVVLDQTAGKKLQLYIDGQPRGGSIPLDSEWEKLTYVRIGQVGDAVPEGMMYLDDVRIADYVAPPQNPDPDPDPGSGSNPGPVIEYANYKFDTYLGPTISTGGSVKLGDLKVYNVTNGSNYITDATLDGKQGKSLKFVTSTYDGGKAMNLAKENFAADLTGKIVMETNIRFDDTNVQRDVLSLRNIGNVEGQTPKYAPLFSFMPSGTIKLNGKTGGPSYQAGIWYKIGVLIDNDAGTVAYYIDGNQVTAPGAEQLPAGWGSVFSVKFTQAGVAGTNAAMYVDDIRVYSGANFAPEQQPGDTPPSAVVNGWEVRYLAGTPSAEGDTGDGLLIPGQYVKANVPGKFDKLSMQRDLPVTGGKTYVMDAWAKVDTTSSAVAINATVTPRKNGQTIVKNGQELKFYGQNNTRGEKIGNEWLRVRVYFIAPADADEIRVEYVISGPATVRLSPQLDDRPEWQDAIGKYSSAGIAHPIQGDITKMFLGWQWTPIAADTNELMMQEIQPLMAMSEAELTDAARTQALSRQYIDAHPEYEAMIRRLAMQYSQTGDENYARRAILIMRQFAAMYDDVPRLILDNDLFHAHGKYIPMEPLYAYDLIYNSPQWGLLEQELGEPIRQSVEGWFRTSFMNLYNLHNDVYYSNIAPYGIRNAMGLAVVLNDPDVIRMMMPWIDTMFSGRQFHADGMWQEGTAAYGGQVTSNVTEALNLLASLYKDPDGYVDTKYGLQLDHTNLQDRWPMLGKASQVFSMMKYPNGSAVGLHDAWTKGQRGETPNKASDPILPQYLNNMELWNFGHFSLTSGDTSDATQVRLTFPPLAEGLPYAAGHYHGNHLGITLWGAGMEMLPDSGYPKGTNRYFNMDTKTHNTGWVWDPATEDYTNRDSEFTRPSLLAYDPGTSSSKAVQLVEASEPGPAGDGTEMKRRLLLLVQTQGNRSYVLDLQRLQGGKAHELFMHSEEDEGTDLTTSLTTQDYPGYTVDQYMKQVGREEGMKQYRDKFKDPKVASGAEDFQFTWAGQESGSSIRAFMNGVDGSETIFSRMPMNRLTQNDNAKMDDFPGWHFYRRHVVNTDEVTRYGAVYETWRDSQTPVVQSVAWESPDQSDPMSTVAVVKTDTYRDLVYISDDTVEREFEGVKFAGKVALLRQDLRTGRYVWGYVYGEGHITANAFQVSGTPDIYLHAVEASGSIDGSVPNTLKLDGALPANAQLQGVWLRTEFGDSSGFGLRIESASGSTIQVHDDPGFTVTPGGVQMKYFPGVVQPETGLLNQHAGDQDYYVPRVVSGEAKVEIRKPFFQLYVAPPTDSGSEPSDGGDSDTGMSGTGTTGQPTTGGTGTPESPTTGTGTSGSPATGTPAPPAGQGGGTANGTGTPGSSGSASGEIRFMDVAANHWAKAAIETLTEKGIISGYDDGSFKPDGLITRAEFASLLVRLLGLKEGEGPTFADVGANDWYRDVAAAVAAAGIVNGYEDGGFRPNNQITREEMAVMAARALKLVAGADSAAGAGSEPGAPGGSTDAEVGAFKDSGQMSDWAQAGIEANVKMGIMSGRGDGVFAPKEPTTRAEAASIVFAIYQLLDKK